MGMMQDAPSQSKGGDIVQTGGGDAGPAPKNTDEIDIDDDDDDDGGDAGGGGGGGKGQLGDLGVQEKAAPASLYGALLKEGEEPQGALARFRASGK